VVADPSRGLLHRPRKLRQRGRRSHEQLQDVPAAGIGEKLDISEGVDRFNLLHDD